MFAGYIYLGIFECLQIIIYVVAVKVFNILKMSIVLLGFVIALYCKVFHPVLIVFLVYPVYHNRCKWVRAGLQTKTKQCLKL